MTLRIGILGAARIAPSALIQPAQAETAIEVTAIAARDPARARAFAKKYAIPTVHASYADLIADPTLDAVYNPLPNHLHGAWTLAALAADKHMLCEKPLAANAHEAAQIADAAQASGRIVMEAFHYFYHPAFQRLFSLVAGGELGNLRRLEAHFCTPLLRLGDIRYRYDLAGGAMMDLGCYVVHMLRKLAGGEPDVVQAQAASLFKDVDRRMEAEFSFPQSPYANSGAAVRARAVCSFFSSTPLRVLLVAECEHGEARLLNPVLPHKFHRLRIREHGVWRTEHFPGESTYTHQLRAFIDALQTGKAPPTHARDGLANMRVIDAVYRAAGLARREPAPSRTLAPFGPTVPAGDAP